MICPFYRKDLKLSFLGKFKKLNPLFNKNVIYNTPLRAQAESIVKQHAIEFTDQDVIFLADNENNGVKQHRFPSSSIQKYVLMKKVAG